MRKKERSKVKKAPTGEEKKCRGRTSVTTTTDSTMSSDVQSAQSLFRHGGPGKGGAQQQGDNEESKRKRALRSTCCSFIGAFAHEQNMSCHACCLLRQVRSCQSACYSVHKSFSAGCCGGFFRGQEEMTMAMSRKKQFVAVFYKSQMLHFLKAKATTRQW